MYDRKVRVAWQGYYRNYSGLTRYGNIETTITEKMWYSIQNDAESTANVLRTLCFPDCKEFEAKPYMRFICYED